MWSDRFFRNGYELGTMIDLKFRTGTEATACTDERRRMDRPRHTPLVEDKFCILPGLGVRAGRWYYTTDMATTEKHIEYWKKGAVEDFAVASDLVTDGRIRHGLFFAHLALEKMLKACVCKHAGPVVPKTHDLIRLCAFAGISPAADQAAFLARFGRYQIEGRYPELLEPEPSQAVAESEIETAEVLLTWLTPQL